MARTKGRGHYPVEVNLLKNLTTKELIDVGNQIVKGSVEDILKYQNNPNASALQVMLAAVVARVIRKGDMQVLDILLNRLIGKVKDEIKLSGEIINPPQIVIMLPPNNRTSPELLKDVTPQIEEEYTFE